MGKACNRIKLDEVKVVFPIKYLLTKLKYSPRFGWGNLKEAFMKKMSFIFATFLLFSIATFSIATTEDSYDVIRYARLMWHGHEGIIYLSGDENLYTLWDSEVYEPLYDGDPSNGAKVSWIGPKGEIGMYSDTHLETMWDSKEYFMIL